jgi:CRISPR/Cas system-associated protein Cas7 (RAMP superfamily)
MTHLQQTTIQTQNTKLKKNTKPCKAKNCIKLKKNYKAKKTQYVLEFQIIKSDLKSSNLKLYFKHQII